MYFPTVFTRQSTLFSCSICSTSMALKTPLSSIGAGLLPLLFYLCFFCFFFQVIESSPPRSGEHGDWHTPTRTRVRMLHDLGHGYGSIKKQMQTRYGVNLPKSTIRNFCKAPRARRLRRGIPGRPFSLTARTVRYLAFVIRKGWCGRRLSWSRLKALEKLGCSTRTIGRALAKLGYHRCVACKRPFITYKQTKTRTKWARRHLCWTLNNWTRVVWSDECSFIMGERGRLLVTRRRGERYYKDCLQSVYRSGRIFFMV